MTWNKRKDNSKLKIRAKKLRDKELSYYKIGKILGKHQTVIKSWLDPEYRKKRRKISSKINAKRYHSDPEFRRNLIQANVKNISLKKKYCKTFQRQLHNYEQKRLKLAKKLKRLGKIKDNKRKSCIYCKSKRIFYYGYTLRILQNQLLHEYRCHDCKRVFL